MEKNLIKVLKQYGISGSVQAVNNGPMVTQIVFHPAPGTRQKKITDAIGDIGRELGVRSLRAEPIAGTDDIGFEIPAEKMQTVDFNAILASDDFKNAKGDLPICLGVDITGKPVFYDVAKMPHLLVSGTTRSGKSVGLNTFILSIIKRLSPEDVRLVLVDPKRIEFSIYNDQRYMLWPVITDNEKASDALESLVTQMEERYQTLSDSKCKNIGDYNAGAGHMPYIVCVIDEFADLIMSNKKVAKSIMMLAQKARAAGIHIILSTQRPSVDIVTGALKANLPTRLAYKVATMTDSRTILDRPGAEDLIGRGDSLFLAPDGTLTRIHGAFIEDAGIENILKPFRGRVNPLPVTVPAPATVSAERPSKVPARTTPPAAPKTTPCGRAGKSLPREALDTWNALPKKTKTTVIAGTAAIVGGLFKTFFGKK